MKKLPSKVAHNRPKSNFFSVLRRAAHMAENWFFILEFMLRHPLFFLLCGNINREGRLCPPPPDFQTLCRSCSVASLRMQLMNKQLSLIIGALSDLVLLTMLRIHLLQAVLFSQIWPKNRIDFNYNDHFPTSFPSVCLGIWKKIAISFNVLKNLLSINKQKHRGKSSTWWRFTFQRLYHPNFQTNLPLQTDLQPKGFVILQKNPLELHPKTPSIFC